MRHFTVVTRVVPVFVALFTAVALAGATTYPILNGDPIDPNSNPAGGAYTILPGLPLIVDPGHGDPLVIDQTKIGDVDLVARAGTPLVGPTIPPPAASLPSAIAGGTHIASGSELPFRIIASDGAASPAAGNPLLGPELDGMPAVVFVFADLDGDGIIGPTNDDPAGSLDNARELQEALFPVGRQVAVFENGVASGTVAIGPGAPASAGGLTVVLTAAAYIGPFDTHFMNNNVPNGPPVATMFPFLPRLAADRVVDGNGAGGRAGDSVRISLALEPSVAPLVGDPVLGTPFAIPTDGSSVTVDRARVDSGPFTRARFVRPSDPTDFSTVAGALPTRFYRGAGGALLAPLSEITIAGNPVSAQIVPVDRLDNVTLPPASTSVTLRAGPGVAIVSPDTDADPSQETLPLDSDAAVAVTLAAVNVVPGDGTLDLTLDGYVVDSLVVHLPPPGSTTTTLPGATTTTSTTSTTVASTTTTTVPSCGVAATFTSIACRLDALRLAIEHDVPAGMVLDRALVSADRARVGIADAIAANATGQRRATRAGVRAVTHQLGVLRSRFKSRQAQRTVDTSVLARLLADVTQLLTDVKTLRATL